MASPESRVAESQ